MSSKTKASYRQSLLLVLWEASLGGVERQAQLLCEAANATNWFTQLLVLGPKGPALSRFGSCCDGIVTLDNGNDWDFKLYTRILRAISGCRFDLGIVFSTAKIAVVGAALGASCRRIAVHVGNPVSQNWAPSAKHFLRSVVFKPPEDMVFVANSTHTLDSLLQNAYFRRFECVKSLNCVEIPSQSLGLRKNINTLRIGMVARLDSIKDHATVVRALPLLLNSGLSVECEFIGDGPQRRKLETLAASLGVGDIVNFIGTVSDVYARLAHWDIFVFSTTSAEGFGNAAAEAMANGLPCVFTDVGPCREVGGDSVAYVPAKNPSMLAETLIGLQRDSCRRLALGENARQRSTRIFQNTRKFTDILLSIGYPNGTEH